MCFGRIFKEAAHDHCKTAMFVSFESIKVPDAPQSELP